MSTLLANFVAIVAAVTAIVALAKTRPARWLIKRNIADPVTEWAKTLIRGEVTSMHANIVKRVELLEEKVAENHHVAGRIELSLNELKRNLGL